MGSKANPTKLTAGTPETDNADLAALLVLHAVSAALGPQRTRLMGLALLAAVDDWTRDEVSAPALRRTAERFGRPAARMLLAEDTPPRDMPGA